MNEFVSRLCSLTSRRNERSSRFQTRQKKSTEIEWPTEKIRTFYDSVDSRLLFQRSRGSAQLRSSRLVVHAHRADHHPPLLGSTWLFLWKFTNPRNRESFFKIPTYPFVCVYVCVRSTTCSPSAWCEARCPSSALTSGCGFRSKNNLFWLTLQLAMLGKF